MFKANSTGIATARCGRGASHRNATRVGTPGGLFCKMDERLRFVARLLEGEKMAVLCREFDISRKTGYKIYARYQDCGRSRRPYRHANRLPFQIETLIVQLKKEHPSWGDRQPSSLHPLRGDQRVQNMKSRARQRLPHQPEWIAELVADCDEEPEHLPDVPTRSTLFTMRSLS
jgi:Homeodomain-like domain